MGMIAERHPDELRTPNRTRGGGLQYANGMGNAEAEAPVEQSQMCGGIDFAHLAYRLPGRLSGSRAHSYQMVITRAALDRLHRHGDSSPRIEVCGVLVGNVYRDDFGPYLLIEHVIEGPSHGSAGQVTFTAETWQYLQGVMDRDYSTLRIVGWYHTHPNHGIFLSDMDLFLHENFFGLPWQAALVYDPQRKEEGIFGWHGKPADRADYLIAENERTMRAEFESARSAAKAKMARKRFRQAVLSITGLVLFAMAGYLLGMMILQMHIRIPWPTRAF